MVGGGQSDDGQRKAAVESLISLISRISESHAQLGERLLWVDGEAVQFVKDVSSPSRHPPTPPGLAFRRERLMVHTLFVTLRLFHHHI